VVSCLKLTLSLGWGICVEKTCPALLQKQLVILTYLPLTPFDYMNTHVFGMTVDVDNIACSTLENKL
jgi:hypothetical protein